VATNNRMALLEQLSKYVVEKDKDFLKEALTLLINALMDAEVTSIIGAEKYERNNNNFYICPFSGKGYFYRINLQD